jgi:pimeloyl-ACP methyl ester carboxylesterase
MISAQATIPTSDHTLTRADGRRVAWAEWGDPEGQPVVLLHRNPGSRLLDPDPRATAAAGARLITIDRPGYGRTDSVAEPTLFAVSSDLADVVDGIGLDEVALIGWSGGGMFALQAAAALGPRARSLSLLCTPAPDEELPWVPDEFRELTAQVQSDPERALAAITDACEFYAQAQRGKGARAALVRRSRLDRPRARPLVCGGRRRRAPRRRCWRRTPLAARQLARDPRCRVDRLTVQPAGRGRCG